MAVYEDTSPRGLRAKVCLAYSHQENNYEEHLGEHIVLTYHAVDVIVHKTPPRFFLPRSKVRLTPLPRSSIWTNQPTPRRRQSVKLGENARETNEKLAKAHNG